MKTKGAKNKTIKQNPIYKGPIPTFDAFVNLYTQLVVPNEEVMRKKYESLMNDLKKTRFMDYRKTNYDFLTKVGLHQRMKPLIPRFKKCG